MQLCKVAGSSSSSSAACFLLELREPLQVNHSCKRIRIWVQKLLHKKPRSCHDYGYRGTGVRSWLQSMVVFYLFRWVYTSQRFGWHRLLSSILWLESKSRTFDWIFCRFSFLVVWCEYRVFVTFDILGYHLSVIFWYVQLQCLVEDWFSGHWF